MKILKSVFLVAIAAFFFSACSKSNDAPPPATNDSVQGVWAGKFGIDNEVPSVFFSYQFKAGGVLEELTNTGQVKGTGTWKIENNIVSGYTINVLAPVGNKYSMVGAYNAAQGKILGNWGYGSSSTNGGLWEMSKKNQ